jgi:hypothetical protein
MLQFALIIRLMGLINRSGLDDFCVKGVRIGVNGIKAKKLQTKVRFFNNQLSMSKYSKRPNCILKNH